MSLEQQVIDLTQATKDYTLLYDGFKETVKFAVAPPAASWIQIHAEKES